MIEFNVLLKRNNLTYRKLGEITNLDFADIFQFAKGRRSYPLVNVILLARALHVSTGELYEPGFRFTSEFVKKQYHILLGNFTPDYYAGLYDEVEPMLVDRLKIFSQICLIKDDKNLQEIINVAKRLVEKEEAQKPDVEI